jgi:hypothetical protein
MSIIISPYNIQELLVGGLRVYWIKRAESSPSHGNSWENALFVLHGRKGSALKYIEQHLDFLGLLACFTHVFLIDHRNHGERLLDQLQNEGKDKNAKHAIDMYSIQLGTAQDIGFLIEVLPLYISGIGYSNTRWGVLGMLALVNDPALNNKLRDRVLSWRPLCTSCICTV